MIDNYQKTKMKINQIEDKQGNVLKTQDGQVLYEYLLEEGDLFIPQWNKIVSKDIEYEKDGVKKTTKNYTLKAEVVNKEGEVVLRKNDGESIIYITLTAGQAKSIQTRIDNARASDSEDLFINQHRFKATTYTNEHGEQIGVSMFGTGPKAKSFKDFESSKSEDQQE